MNNLPRLKLPDNIAKLEALILKRRQLLSIAQRKLNQIQDRCKHQFPPHGTVAWMDSETCVLCGKDCHDPEEWK